MELLFSPRRYRVEKNEAKALKNVIDFLKEKLSKPKAELDYTMFRLGHNFASSWGML